MWIRTAGKLWCMRNELWSEIPITVERPKNRWKNISKMNLKKIRTNKEIGPILLSRYISGCYIKDSIII